jgi:glucosamine kinase
MKLIADAGGTSTHWRAINDQGESASIETRGLNLLHHQVDDFLFAIKKDIEPYKEVREVHFYVAGLLQGSGFEERLKKGFGDFFSHASLHFQNDLIATGRSLCGHLPGWIGILGTGSNVAYYDGKAIQKQIAPLGYLLGDEGSGAYLGKELVKLLLREQLDQDLIDAFEDRYRLSGNELLRTLYEKKDPKLFLASFTTFLRDFKQREQIQDLIFSAFNHHFDVFLKDKNDDMPLHYTGSVAFHFNDCLRSVASNRGIALGQINQDPIDGLMLYHSEAEDQVN